MSEGELHASGPDGAPAPRWRAHHDVRAADSAGVPWHGRELSPQPFAGDDGSTPPAYAAALARFQAGESGPEPVVAALRGARLLVPLLAELGEEGRTEDGRVVDKQADLSIVTVAGPDGRRVLPAFTSVAALAAWRSEARPVPVEAIRAAIAAIDDDTQLVVLDPGSPGEFGLRRPAVWALAKGEAWMLPWRRPEVVEAIAAALAEVAGVVGVELAPASAPGSLLGPELGVRIETAGLDDADRAALADRLRARWAEDRTLVEHVDSLAVAVVPAPEPEAAPPAGLDDGAAGRERAGGAAAHPEAAPGPARGIASWLRGGGRR